jgi:hypothetical protein
MTIGALIRLLEEQSLELYIGDNCLIIKSIVTIFKVFQVESSEPIVVLSGNIIQQINQLLEIGSGVTVNVFDFNS